MSNPAVTGLFAQAQREGRLCAVAMNDVQFLTFNQSTISAIGTEGLSGCSVVMVTSQYGGILAHIPPRPSMTGSQDVHAGDQNVQALMNRVANLYTQWQNYFPGADTFVVCAVYAGDVALPDQKRIIEDNISRMGLSPSSPLFYDVPTNRANPGQGTALIDSYGRAGQKPAVYVEDRLVSGEGAMQQQAQASSSEWVFDQTYQRYRRFVDGKWEWAR